MSNVSMTDSQDPQIPERLRAHFSNHDVSAHPNRWDDLWKTQEFLPWDRGTPNPALTDILTDRTDLIGPSTISGKRKRALIPGCGKGYDVLLLAAFGYDAYGVEASANAKKAAEDFMSMAGTEGRSEYVVRDQNVGKGVIKCVLGDFFKDDWAEKEVGGGIREGFDLIYDNTFLCALPPVLRPAWARRMSQLLAPTGHLICLEFPSHKPPLSGGPPWAVPPIVYEELLAAPGEEIKYDDGWNVIRSYPAKVNDLALERIAHWQPERTHEVGKGKDWVSIWKHKQ